MSGSSILFIFKIGGKRIAIPLKSVERVIRAVAVITIPHSPATFHGVIDLHTQIVPVINIRRRLDLPDKAISRDDRFVIAKLEEGLVVLVVDEVEGIIEVGQDELVSANELGNGLKLEGAIRNDDGIILSYEVNHFVEKEESRQLLKVLKTKTGATS
jgi:purine-binding chemotaxis protein CheW